MCPSRLLNGSSLPVKLSSSLASVTAVQRSLIFQKIGLPLLDIDDAFWGSLCDLHSSFPLCGGGILQLVHETASAVCRPA
jgi:hypothetical protein